eukprot:6613431-Alexandrium_andersonii.AAC.1
MARSARPFALHVWAVVVFAPPLSLPPLVHSGGFAPRFLLHGRLASSARGSRLAVACRACVRADGGLSLIHISEPTRLALI